jgi:hypothetical protein
MPNYVDVNNMDQNDYKTTITTIINIFVNRNAGLTPRDHFFSLLVNRLSDEGHVSNQVAISLSSTRMMNANMPNPPPYQVHQPPNHYNYPPNPGQQLIPNYPPNLAQQQIPNFNYGIQPQMMYANRPMQPAQQPGFQVQPVQHMHPQVPGNQPALQFANWVPNQQQVRPWVNPEPMLPAFGVPRAAAGLPNQVNRQLVAAMPPPNQMPNQVNQQPVVPMLNPNMGPNAVVGCRGAGGRLDRRRRPNPPIPMVIGGNGDDEESLATVSVPPVLYLVWYTNLGVTSPHCRPINGVRLRKLWRKCSVLVQNRVRRERVLK